MRVGPNLVLRSAVQYTAGHLLYAAYRHVCMRWLVVCVRAHERERVCLHTVVHHSLLKFAAPFPCNPFTSPTSHTCLHARHTCLHAHNTCLCVPHMAMHGPHRCPLCTTMHAARPARTSCCTHAMMDEVVVSAAPLNVGQCVHNFRGAALSRTLTLRGSAHSSWCCWCVRPCTFPGQLQPTQHAMCGQRAPQAQLRREGGANVLYNLSQLAHGWMHVWKARKPQA